MYLIINIGYEQGPDEGKKKTLVFPEDSKRSNLVGVGARIHQMK